MSTATVGTRLWEILLREAKALTDATIARGVAPEADEIARRTLAAHPDAEPGYYTPLERALRDYIDILT